MSAPDTTADPACGCRVDLGEVCGRCDLRQQADAQIDAMSRDLGLPVPTATMLRPTPGSPPPNSPPSAPSTGARCWRYTTR